MDKHDRNPSFIPQLLGENPPLFTPRRDPHYTSHCLLSLPLSHRCLLSPLLHLLMIWSCCDSPPTPLTAVLSACYHHEAAAWQGRELSQLETLTCARQNSLPPSLRPPHRLTETFVASQPALTQQACKFNRRSLDQSVSTKTSYDAFMSLTESYPCSPPFLTLSHTTVKSRCAANSRRSVLLTNNKRQLA